MGKVGQRKETGMERKKRKRQGAGKEQGVCQRKRCRGKERGSGEDTAVLPSDLLDSIVLRLPLESLGAARCVCRNWNLAIGSSGFQARKAKLDHETGRFPSPYLASLMGRYRKKWLCVLDPNTGLRRNFMFPGPTSGCFNLALLAGGLVFIAREYRSDSVKLCAWNPLTGFMKELVVSYKNSFFVVHSTALTHKLFLYDKDHLLERETFMDLEAARTSGDRWNRVDYIVYDKQECVYSDGYLVSVTNSELVARHVVTGEVLTLVLPKGIMRWGKKVAVYRGSLLLLAVTTRSRKLWEQMLVWRLEGSLGSQWEWRFVSEMPPELHEVIFTGIVIPRSWKCNVVGDVVIISSVHRRGKKQEGVVFLDMTNLIWKAYNGVQHQNSNCFWTDPRPIYLSFGSLDLSKVQQ